MFPPPGFDRPLWRGWEEAREAETQLVEAISSIENSIGSCHREQVKRDETHCPISSNQHHYVKQIPHTRHEAIPRTRRGRKQGIIIMVVT